MKIINCNDWAPRNTLGVSTPITNPLIANHNSLYDNFYVRGVAWVYHNLSEPTITYHYFYEDD
jgi:hypothetical protein